MGTGVFVTTALAALISLTGNSSNIGLTSESNQNIANPEFTIAQSRTEIQDFSGCSAELTAMSPSSQINYRSAPSISGRRLGYGLVGDRLTILDATIARNGFTWYNVRFELAPYAEGWIRGDFVQRLGNCTISEIPNSMPREEQNVLEVPREAIRETDEGAGTSANRLFNSTQVRYFMEVALGSEYGNSSAAVRRWENDVCIDLNFPESENISSNVKNDVTNVVEDVVRDLNVYFEELEDHIEKLEDRVSDRYDNWNPIEVAIAGEGCSNPNIEFYYVKAENFSNYDSNAQRGQVGHVWTWWRSNEINRARILISSNYLTDTERDHVIREEITQSLGILKDSWDYPTSIFYQGWTSVTNFDEIDIAVIKMLYHPAIRPGMGASEAQGQLDYL